MSRKVERWEAIDGSLFTSEYEAMKHEAGAKSHKCPKCKGFGHCNSTVKKTVREFDREATGWGGNFAQPVYRDRVVGFEQMPCDVCGGVGWTADPVEPITETKIVGWKPKP